MEWISVKERLPQQAQIIIATDGDISLPCHHFTDTGFTWFTKEVTHWMPLPQPPKADD